MRFSVQSSYIAVSHSRFWKVTKRALLFGRRFALPDLKTKRRLFVFLLHSTIRQYISYTKPNTQNRVVTICLTLIQTPSTMLYKNMKMMHFFFKNRKKVVNPEKCTRYIEIHLLIFSGHYFHHIGIRLPCIDDNTYDPASGNDPASGTLPIQHFWHLKFMKSAKVHMPKGDLKSAMPKAKAIHNFVYYIYKIHVDFKFVNRYLFLHFHNVFICSFHFCCQLHFTKKVHDINFICT